ncbi:MAG: hypothetical protein AB4050_13580 [Synechococcus sp.]
MRIQRSLTAVLLGLAASTWGGMAFAQTEFKVLGRPVLTIRQPQESTDERVRQIDGRLMAIVEAADDERLDVTVEGTDRLAQLLVNDTLLLDVTLEDAEANATNTAIALAEVWKDRLVSVLEQPDVLNELFRTANMPEQLTVANRQYVMMSEPVADRGQFVTDGSRAGDRVIFWVDESNAAQNHNAGAPEPEQTTLPNPIPEQIYVLNRFREFISYRAI